MGLQLNVGINTDYVSQANQNSGNQDRVNGKDVVLGLVPSTPSSNISNATAYTNREWDYGNAVELAKLLLNPNLANYDPVTRTYGTTPQNASGQNRQNQALLDFAAIFSASQKESGATNNNGSLEEQLGRIRSARTLDEQKAIQKALFGDGTQTNGLIDSGNLLLGGTGLSVGDQLTADSLARLMGPISGVDYSAWVEPFKRALAQFGVNTPQRIAAFFAQVVNETTGLKEVVEKDNDWTVSNLSNPALFGNRFLGQSGHQDAAGNPLTWAQYLGRPNNQAPLLPEATARTIANMAYNGKNGNVPGTDDGWNFRGRGPFHLTGRDNYEAFARSVFGVGSATYNQIMNTPSSMDNDFYMLALTAAWYWVNHPTQTSVNLSTTADNLPSVAAQVTRSQFDVISRVIASDTASYANRLNSYRRDMGLIGNGGNPYESMQEVLKRLGFGAANTVGYQNRFGITLRPSKLPTPISDGGHLQLADGVAFLSDALDGTDRSDTVAMQSLLNQARTELNLTEVESMVFALPIPDLPLASPSIVMVAQGNQVQKSAQKAERAVGVCELVDNSDGGSDVLYATSDAITYLQEYENRNDLSDEDMRSANTSILQQPKHGTLFPNADSGLSGDYRYTPSRGYTGTDSAVVLVEIKGVKVRVHYFFHVLNSPTLHHWDEECGKKGARWKISSASGDGVRRLAREIVSQGTTTDEFLVRNRNIDLAFSDLKGEAIGQTVERSDGTTQINLDFTAASHGWFIDPTPGSNEEFLPTADPNVWKAKPGSAAEGKMDMLTVLLHEYGHALGLDHTADAHDFMAATLSPGVRRTLSAEDQMALMRLTGYVPVPDSPSDPFSPFLGAPLVFGLGRLRGSFSDAFAAAANGGAEDNRARLPQYEVAPNPTLTNPEFAGNTGWSTTGTVTFGNNAAVLTESATAQTRLNQLFVVGDHDRFLRFTLADIALDDVNAAPDDAFEVALIDANTGASLLGGTGLTRSDALLNLQANGTERLAPQVTSTLNPDGSRTYLVDLSGVAAGTVASLSFDLIGFGRGAAATSSRVTVRDLKLGIPETHDDVTTIAEDTPATIAALANDLDANQPGFVPVIVSGPAHGQVLVNADGTFGYTPDRDWFGDDSFSYKLTDGRVDSNSATVRAGHGALVLNCVSQIKSV